MIKPSGGPLSGSKRFKDSSFIRKINSSNLNWLAWGTTIGTTGALNKGPKIPPKPRNLGPFVLRFEASGLGELGVALVEEGEL